MDVPHDLRDCFLGLYILKAESILKALLLAAVFLGTSSDVASMMWLWAGAPIWLILPRPFVWCLVVEWHTLAPLATSHLTYLQKILSCQRGPGWSIGVPIVLACLLIDPIYGYCITWVTCNYWSPLGSTPDPSCIWIGHLIKGLLLLWGILDKLIPCSCGICVESFFQDCSRSYNGCHPPPGHRPMSSCCPSERRQFFP